MSPVLIRCQHCLELQVVIVSTVRTPLLPPMMTCCATARWKLPTETSVYGDRQWLFLILFPLNISCNTHLEALTDQLRCIVFQQVSCRSCSHLSVRSTLPPQFTTACKMMIWHWAPTIRDGYAYHGRPQKPRRLILMHCMDLWRCFSKDLADQQAVRDCGRRRHD
jgi:hypothetical protein